MCHTGCNGPAIGQQQQQHRQKDGDCCRQRRRWWWRGASPSSGGTDRGNRQPQPEIPTTTTTTTRVPSSEADLVMMDITGNRTSTTCASIPSTQKKQQHQQHPHHQLHSSSSSRSSSSNSDRHNSHSCRNITTSTREPHITSVVSEVVASSLDHDDHCSSSNTLCTQDCDHGCSCWKGGGDGGDTRSSNSDCSVSTQRPIVPSFLSSSPFSATLRSLLQLSLQQCVFTVLLLCLASFSSVAECCSSRSTPKPRPPSPTTRPNVTFLTYACPPAYAAWYCLNGATCFTVKIGDSILYNCECADGYMGQRCEFKDLDGSYLPAREKVLLETASIAGGATVATVLVFVVLFALYVIKQRDKDKRDLDETSDRRPFSGYQSTRPETFHTISNPYARTAELSHVEVVGSGSGNVTRASDSVVAVSSSASCNSLHSPS